MCKAENIVMTLTLTELERVVAELNETVLGGHIQKVGQPSERGIVLQVRAPGETHHVYLCADPGLARVHLLSLPPRNPPTPPQFCMVLRKHLVGGAIESIELLWRDRVVKFNIRGKDEQGSATARGLVIEIVPGFENIILLDEHGMIVEALRRAVSKGGRRIVPREAYGPPPAVEAGAAAAEDHFEEPLRELKLATYSAAVEQAYAEQDESVRAENIRREVSAALSKVEKRAKRRAGKIEKDFEATGQSDLMRLKGELLKANLHSVRKGQTSVDLPDTIGGSGETISIHLDPALSPQDNMRKYFRRAKKLRGGRAIIESRLSETRAQLALLAELRRRLDEAEGLDELQKLREELPSAVPRVVRKGRPQEVRTKPREFTSADGQTILVGRNPRQNDQLTLRASGSDMWLHVQHYPGSHVIIKMEKGRPLLKETLLDAAHLAMHFSKLRDADKAPIDYAYRKYVKKPRHSVPGYVTYSQQKTMMLVPDKRRLARLLKKG